MDVWFHTLGGKKNILEDKNCLHRYFFFFPAKTVETRETFLSPGK